MTDGDRYLTIALAVALQIAVTLPIGEYGLRLAISDLFLPSTVWTLLLIVRWDFGSDGLIRVPGAHWWLLAISIAISFGLARGWAAVGEVSQWALVNKWLGWFVLAGYFLAAAFLARELRDDFRRLFLASFLYTTAAVAAAGLVAYPILFTYRTLPVFVQDHRLTGLMQNSNAFGFLLVVALLLCLATWRGRWALALPSIYLTGIWFTASRGAMIAAVAGLAALLFKRRDLWTPTASSVAIAGLAAMLVTVITIAPFPSMLFDANKPGLTRSWTEAIGERQIGLLGSERTQINSHDIITRMNATTTAAKSIAENPLFGVGLGTFVHQLKRQDSKVSRTLHNSALWLVTELGVIGAAPWIGFLIVCLIAFYKRSGDPLSVGMFAVAVAFMAASIAGEFLYQRHLWFLLGMSLALPNTKRYA